MGRVKGTMYSHGQLKIVVTLFSGNIHRHASRIGNPVGVNSAEDLVQFLENASPEVQESFPGQDYGSMFLSAAQIKDANRLSFILSSQPGLKEKIVQGLLPNLVGSVLKKISNNRINADFVKEITTTLKDAEWNCRALLNATACNFSVTTDAFVDALYSVGCADLATECAKIATILKADLDAAQRPVIKSVQVPVKSPLDELLIDFNAPLLQPLPIARQVAPLPPQVAPQVGTECSVCMEEKPNGVFTGCGHVCICDKCATNIKSCPICRKESQYIKLFFA